jgi:hypothetical protein
MLLVSFHYYLLVFILSFSLPFILLILQGRLSLRAMRDSDGYNTTNIIIVIIISNHCTMQNEEKKLTHTQIEGSNEIASYGTDINKLYIYLFIFSRYNVRFISSSATVNQSNVSHIFPSPPPALIPLLRRLFVPLKAFCAYISISYFMEIHQQINQIQNRFFSVQFCCCCCYY